MFEIVEATEEDRRSKIRPGAPTKYPFADLNVGQGFTVPGMSASDMAPRAGYWAKKLGRKYSARTRLDGCFVFRVS